MAAVIETVATSERVAFREHRHLASDDAAVGETCLLCNGAFAESDHVMRVLLGCGTDADQRLLASRGRTYESKWLLLHVACVSGMEE
jgi:hypothetical protein